jgi:DNA-binding XRE family transcriptional regulator
MSTKSSFRAALERPAAHKERSPVRSGSPVRLVLRFDEVEKPVTVARLLTRHGLSLRKAHDVLDRLADGNTVSVELYADDARALVSEFLALGVNALPINPPEPDVKRIRERLGLSQAEFSIRFGFELDTVQNWEQGRTRPDPAGRTLLGLIEAYPECVDAVLTKTELTPKA